MFTFLVLFDRIYLIEIFNYTDIIIKFCTNSQKGGEEMVLKIILLIYYHPSFVCSVLVPCQTHYFRGMKMKISTTVLGKPKQEVSERATVPWQLCHSGTKKHTATNLCLQRRRDKTAHPNHLWLSCLTLRASTAVCCKIL